MRRIDAKRTWGMRYDGDLIPYDPNFAGDYKAVHCRLLAEYDYRLMRAVIRTAERLREGLAGVRANQNIHDLRIALDAFNAPRKTK